MRTALLAVLSLGVGAMAQGPAPASEEPAEETSPATLPSLEEALGLVRGAARERPIDQAATIKTEDADGVSRDGERVVLHLDATGPDTRMRLDFGGFRVAAGQRRIVAVRNDAPEKYVETDGERRLTPREVLSLMPALPLPQVPLVLGGAAWEPSDAAFCLGATWTGVESREENGQLKIAGVSRRGPVWLWIDPEARSVVRMEAVISRPHGQKRTLRVSFETVPTLEPGEWTLDTEGRQRVQTLAQLRPGPKALAVGDSADGLPLLDSSLSPASLPDVLRQTKQRLPEPKGPVAVAILAFRPAAAGAADEGVLNELSGLSAELVSAQRRVRSRVAGARRTSADCPVIAVGVVGVKEFSRPRLFEFAAAWERARPKDESLWPLVAWSVGSVPMERLMTSGEGPVVILVGENGQVAAIEPASAGTAWEPLFLKALGVTDDR